MDEATCYGVFWCHWCVWKSLPICVRATPECMCVDSVNKSNLYKLIRCNLQCVWSCDCVCRWELMRETWISKSVRCQIGFVCLFITTIPLSANIQEKELLRKIKPRYKSEL